MQCTIGNFTDISLYVVTIKTYNDVLLCTNTYILNKSYIQMIKLLDSKCLNSQVAFAFLIMRSYNNLFA